MPKTKNKKLKISQALFLLSFLMILGLFISQEASAACQNVPIGGSYELQPPGEETVCMFSGTVVGVENGNLTIPAGKSLTINAGQTVVWNPTYSVIINGSISIDRTPPGGQLRKAYIWMSDADKDGYSTSTEQYLVSAESDIPANGARRKDMNSITELDCNDDEITCWRNRYTDSDMDTHCAGSSLTCVGDHAGYVDVDSCVTFNDCDDGNNEIYPGTTAGTKDCDNLDGYIITGTDPSPTATGYCKYRDYSDKTKYCQADGTISDPTCNSYSDTTKATCADCKKVGTCSAVELL